MSANDSGEYQGTVSSNWANGEISRRDATIAAQAAEIERLTQNRDYWMTSCKLAWEHRDGANDKVAELEVELTSATDSRKESADLLSECRKQLDIDRDRLDTAHKMNRGATRTMVWLHEDEQLRYMSGLIGKIDALLTQKSENADADSPIAALRSQLEEQRKRLDGARKFVFNTSQGAIVVEPLCSGWRCYRDTMDWTAWENLKDPESNSMTFATLDKLFAALYTANWLTPHAEEKPNV